MRSPLYRRRVTVVLYIFEYYIHEILSTDGRLEARVWAWSLNRNQRFREDTCCGDTSLPPSKKTVQRRNLSRVNVILSLGEKSDSAI